MTTTPQDIRTAPAAGSYELDQSHSHVSFSARHLMVTKVRGRFAVESGDPKRDEHLRSVDFFDAENHPTVTFRSTKVDDHDNGEFTLEGDLTVKDTTRPVTLKGEYLGAQESPWGDTRIGFSAEVEVSRKEWGLEWNVALETGGVLVGDKVKLTIDAEWVRA